MLALKIISTVLLGLTCMTKIASELNNITISEESITLGIILWEILWKAFVIVTIWVI